MQDAAVFDSSCSAAARVYYIGQDGGLYLKTGKYYTRFLDAYGRENFEKDVFRTIAPIEVFL